MQERLPKFRPVMEAYYAGLMALGRRLLRLLALTLELPEEWFVERFTKPIASLRPLHYSAKISKPEDVRPLHSIAIPLLKPGMEPL